MGRDGSSVLIPLDEISFRFLEETANDPGASIRVIKLAPQTQVTKGIVMGYPLRLPLSILQRHPQVEEAVRCQTSRHKEDTRQVLVTLRGPLIPSLTLGNWGTFYLRPYVPEPLRCHRCQKFGHHRATCSRNPICGVCSGQHDTQRCLTRYKAKEDVTHRCPNCGGPHHAWNPSCPVRLSHIHHGRELQVNWVKEQQTTTVSPAPPGTFVWGQQQSSNRPSPPPPTQADFPQLPTATTPTPTPPLPPPGQPTPSTHTPATTPATPSATAPLPLPPQEPLFTTADLKEFGKQLALGVATSIAQLLGKDVDQDALEKAMEKTVTNAMETLISKRSRQPRKPSPVRVMRVRIESSSLPRTYKTPHRPPSQPAPGPQTPTQGTKPKALPSFNGTALEPTPSYQH